MVRDQGKPRGKMTAYAFYMQTYREEHRKKLPGVQINFAAFSRQCAASWKAGTCIHVQTISGEDKQRFVAMAARDKARFERDMLAYVPRPSNKQAAPKRRRKDANAPKRPVSAFFMFCNMERAAVRERFPQYGVTNVARELGRMWNEDRLDKTKYQQLAALDKYRYEEEMAVYRGSAGQHSAAKA